MSYRLVILGDDGCPRDEEILPTDSEKEAISAAKSGVEWFGINGNTEPTAQLFQIQSSGIETPVTLPWE